MNLIFALYFSSGKIFAFNCSTYTFHKAPMPNPVSWKDSRGICKKTGSDLVSIESVAERRFLKQKIQTLQTTEYYIGLINQSGEWRWINNYTKDSVSKGHLSWGSGEPSGNGNCSEMYLNQEKDLWYDDFPCHIPKYHVGYICEKDGECGNEKGMSQEQYNYIFHFPRNGWISFMLYFTPFRLEGGGGGFCLQAKEFIWEQFDITSPCLLSFTIPW